MRKAVVGGNNQHEACVGQWHILGGGVCSSLVTLEPALCLVVFKSLTSRFCLIYF